MILVFSTIYKRIKSTTYNYLYAQLWLYWRNVTNKKNWKTKEKQESQEKLAHTKIEEKENDVDEANCCLQQYMNEKLQKMDKVNLVDDAAAHKASNWRS